MQETYEEVVAQLRMPTHVPLLDELPASAEPGSTIADPTASRSKERKRWRSAAQTNVALHGISKLQRSLTQSKLYRENSDDAIDSSRSGGRWASTRTVSRVVVAPRA